MTVSSEVNKSGPYSGNGVTTVFGYSFRILDRRDIRVVKTLASGVFVDLVLDADYTVSGVGVDLGGSVTIPAAPPAGVKITLLRKVPFSQGVDLENQGAYFAETIEAALDASVMRDQQLSEEVSRTVKVSPSDDPSALVSLTLNITRLGASADNIDTVASNIGAVNYTSENMTAITAVAEVADEIAIITDAIVVAEARAAAVAAAGTAVAARDISVAASAVSVSARDTSVAAAAVASSASNTISSPSWADLATRTPAFINQRASVSANDAGTHTGRTAASPGVNVAGVANSGVFGGYALAVGAWRRDGAVNVEGIASDAQAVAGLSETLAVSPHGVAAAVDMGRLTSSELIGTLDFALDGAGNAGGVVTSSTRTLSIPAASTGDGSYISGKTGPSTAELASLVGYTLRLRMKATVTAGFVVAKPPVASFHGRVRRTGNVDSNLTPGNSTFIRREQIGTTLYCECDYVVTAADLSFGSGYQMSSASVAGADHSLQIISATWYVVAVPGDTQSTPEDKALAVLFAKKGLNGIPALHFGIGIVYPDATPAPQALNGGVLRAGADGRNSGVTIPLGSSGLSCIMQTVWPFDGALHDGKTLKIQVVHDVSAVFDRLIQNTLQVGLAASTPNRAATVAATVVGNQRITTYTYVVQGDEVSLRPYSNLATAGVTAAEQFITVRDVTVEIVATPSAYLTPMEENLSAMNARNRGGILATAGSTAVAVLNGSYASTTAVDKAGVNTTLLDGRTATPAASATAHRRLLVNTGLYGGGADINFTPSAFLSVEGQQNSRVSVALNYPDNQAVANIAANSALNLVNSTKIKSLRVTARNARYAIHSEASGANVGSTHEIEDCSLQHYGNAGARAYQQGIGTPAGDGSYGVWDAAHAFGLGTASGQVVSVKRCALISDTRYAFGGHNNTLFTNPSRVSFEDCSFVSMSAGNHGAIFWQNFGSRRDDVLELHGCEIGGDIVTFINAASWAPTAIEHQPASHQELQISGYGNSPAMFWTSDFGLALRLRSATVGTLASVELTGGTALELLFGPAHLLSYLPGAVNGGGTNVGGSVEGWADVSGGKAGTSLGARLGDCTSINKTLLLKIDGGTEQTLTFTANYTAQNNTTVVAAINALLGGAAVAALPAPGARYRPRFKDEECTLTNTSTSLIAQGMALAYNTNDRNVRLMTSADDPARYAGQAFEIIPPGRSGRVKCKGYVGLDFVDTIPDQDIAGANAPALWSTFSVSAGNPGRIVKGGTQGLLRVMRAAVSDRPACLKVA